MDDLNRKRLENGKPLSTHGKSEDELNDMLTEACRAAGYNGRTFSGPEENPVGQYRLSDWLPFGEYYDYEIPASVAGLIGYEIMTVQRHDGWWLLYFDADEDRGGCFRRVDVLEEQVVDICRSDVLDGGLIDPVSEFTRVQGEVLTGVEAFRCGHLALHFGARQVNLEWDCPLEPDAEPEGSEVVREQGKADFDRPVVAYRQDTGGNRHYCHTCPCGHAFRCTPALWFGVVTPTGPEGPVGRCLSNAVELSPVWR